MQPTQHNTKEYGAEQMAGDVDQQECRHECVLKYFVPQLTKIWADQAYQAHELANWCMATGGWDLEVVKRSQRARDWSRALKRWVVERTFGWRSRNRRMSKDDLAQGPNQ
jgi:transposase